MLGYPERYPAPTGMNLGEALRAIVLAGKRQAAVWKSNNPKYRGYHTRSHIKEHGEDADRPV